MLLKYYPFLKYTCRIRSTPAEFHLTLAQITHTLRPKRSLLLTPFTYKPEVQLCISNASRISEGWYWRTPLFALLYSQALQTGMGKNQHCATIPFHSVIKSHFPWPWSECLLHPELRETTESSAGKGGDQSSSWKLFSLLAVCCLLSNWRWLVPWLIFSSQRSP